MSKKKSPASKSGGLSRILKDWQRLEDETIKLASEMIKKTKNPVIRMSLELIRQESQKNKVLKQMLMDGMMENGAERTARGASVDFEAMSKNISSEAMSLDFANATLKSSENFMFRTLEQTLMESIKDEAAQLSPRERLLLSDTVKKHLAAKEKSMELAEEAIRGNENFVVRYVLSHMFNNEQKHQRILQDLKGLHPYR